MSKKIFRLVLIVSLSALAFLRVVPQIVLNSSLVSDIVDEWAAEHVDGKLEYADIDFSFIRCFPCVRVTIDSVTLTYPHERFAAYDGVGASSRLLSAGRGPVADTLLRMDRLTAAVNPWQLFSGRLRLSDAHLHSLSVFAHFYDGAHSNFDVLVFPPDTVAVDTSSSSPVRSLPLISIGDVSLARSPRVVYTNQADTVFAVGGFRQMKVGGAVKLSDSFLSARRLDFKLDSLYLLARVPKDSLLVSVGELSVSADPYEYTVNTRGRIVACTGALGRVRVPFRVDAGVGLDPLDEGMRVRLGYLDADVAHLPLSARGRVDLLKDSIFVDASADIRGCRLQELLDEYASAYVTGLKTDLMMNLSASAVGSLSAGRKPAVNVNLVLPEGRLSYEPVSVEGTLALDASATMSEDGVLDARVKTFDAGMDGMSLSMSGSVLDLLGRDPRVGADVDLSACAEPLMRFVPEEMGMSAAGSLRFVANADVTRSQIEKMNFERGGVTGMLTSDSLVLRMATDTLDARLYGTEVDLSADGGGILASANADTVVCSVGKDFRTVVRNMRNTARIYKAPIFRGRYITPKLEVSTSEDGIFMRAGESRMGLGGLALNVAMQRIPDQFRDKRRHYLDSLQRVYPGVPRNRLVETAMMSNPGVNVPKYLLDKEYHSSDISIPVDTNVQKYLRHWIPTASVKLGRAFVATPSLPLRTRLRDLSVGFDGRRLTLDSVFVSCGTSDVSARGSLSGVIPMALGRGILDLNLDVRSHNVNTNELIAAIAKGQYLEVDETQLDENFGTDTLANARIDTVRLEMPMLPANVRANLALGIDTLSYMFLKVSDVNAEVSMRDRTVQAKNVRVNTPLGGASADMYMSTPFRDDMSVGITMSLHDMSAQGIINLVPVVDSLLPALRTFDGLLNCDLSATTGIDPYFNVKFPTLDGLLRISGKDLVIRDAAPLKKITRLLMFKNVNEVRIDDMSVNCVIRNNKIEIFPFILSVDRYRLALRGMQGFDQSMNYHVSVLKAPFLLRFGINAYGTTDDWRIKLGKAMYKDGVPVFTEQLDRMQLNFIDYIRGIYEHITPAGLQKAGIEEELEKRKRELKYSSDTVFEDLSDGESERIEMELQLNAEIDEMTEDLNNEISRSLNAYAEDMDMLLEDYHNQIYDKDIERFMNKALKRKEKKKNGKR